MGWGQIIIFSHTQLQMAYKTHSQSKAELRGSFNNLLEVDAMVQLIFIKLHQQLQELGPLEGEGGENDTTPDMK